VRLGLPVGVRGITQLVAGPQYSTGVGLVQYGATVLAQARERSVSSTQFARAELKKAAPKERAERPRDFEEAQIERQKNGRFWTWLRAAF
jgi:cell division protein FtsA